MPDIVVLGGANIDIKAKVTAPNRLGTSNPGIVSTSAGGVGRNIAHNLARLGADVALISVVGNDVHGDAVLAETRRAGVDVSRVVRSATSTGSYVALLDHDGELITALNDMRAMEEFVPAIVAAHAGVIKSASLVVADCNLPQETLNAVAALVGERLVIEPVSVPKSRKLMEVLKRGPVFLASPNFDQIEQVAGTRDIEGAFAFMHAKASDPEAQQRCERRAVNWLLGMQSKDGGWAAFDVDNDWQLLNRVPFADHNAMLDPTCPDITGRVLEALFRRGFTQDHPAIQRGVTYLLNTQEVNGSWYGRWGVDYIYGAFLAMRALKHARGPEPAEAIYKGARWLTAVQNADGGWGESCASYVENHFVPAPSTASQTAWALLGLLAAGDGHHDAIRRGIEFLTTTQKPDGTWYEDLATGTGFPNVFYLQYTLYRNYFPVLALTQARRALAPKPTWVQPLAAT